MSASRVVAAIRRTMDLVDATPLSQTTATSAMRITVVSTLNSNANDQRAQKIRRAPRMKCAQLHPRGRDAGGGGPLWLFVSAFSFSGVGCRRPMTEPMSPPANGRTRE